MKKKKKTSEITQTMLPWYVKCVTVILPIWCIKLRVMQVYLCCYVLGGSDKLGTHGVLKSCTEISKEFYLFPIY